MIATIGSLVQETTTRKLWLKASTFYTLACLVTSALLGAGLSILGQAARDLVCRGACSWWPAGGAALVGVLAIAYAASDVGLIPMPRPTLWQAVPVTWWRRWPPLGAALAYGAALGAGVFTRIHFGAFYVLCAWCILTGQAAYGAALLGCYGAGRALVLFPASLTAYRDTSSAERWPDSRVYSLWRAQQFMAVVLIAFGTGLLTSSPAVPTAP